MYRNNNNDNTFLYSATSSYTNYSERLLLSPETYTEILFLTITEGKESKETKYCKAQYIKTGKVQ